MSDDDKPVWGEKQEQEQREHLADVAKQFPVKKRDRRTKFKWKS